VRHIYDTHGPDTEVLFGPDMWLGAFVEKELGRPMHVWDGECHVHAGIRPADIDGMRAAHPGADFLIHPECGCSTSVMEYVAAGDISGEGVHMLSTGGMLRYAEQAESATSLPSNADEARGQVQEPGLENSSQAAHENGGPGKVREVVVATETGMLYPLQMAAPDVNFVAANPRAACVYMKMITLHKLRDALKEMKHEVRVPGEIAERARVPIDRMVAIG
jgi:quinolinate synthase